MYAREGDGLPVPNGVDRETGLPVVSLYGKNLTPPPETLADLDGVLVDLQDAGARFYTYSRTMQHLMVSCDESRIPLAVLDRPNPLGGSPEAVEGPLPDSDLPTSFLCPWSFPVRHSLTLGEMALLLQREMGLHLNLAVVTMEGWRRSALWPDTGLPFHPPSPGLPQIQSVFLYPGLALLEATNISEGRGTPLSFRWFGADWMDGEKVAARLCELEIPGLQAQPRELEDRGPRGRAREADSGHPTGGGQVRSGVRLDVTDPSRFRPVTAGLRILALLRTLYPREFSWAPYPTAVNPGGLNHLLHLLRCRRLVEALEGDPGRLLDGEALAMGIEAPGWWDRARPHLLYD